MRTRTVVAVVLSLGVAIGLASVAILQTVDFNRYRNFISERIESIIGCKMVINGDLKITSLFHPTLVMHNVTLANVSWGSQSEMMTVRRFEIQVAWLPLLSGRFKIHRLILVEPNMLVEITPDRRNNWTSNTLAPALLPPGTPMLLVFDATTITVKQATLTVRDSAHDTVHTLQLARLVATADGLDSPVDLSIEGRLGAVPIQGQGRVGTVADLLANRPFAIDVAVTAADTTVTLTGVITRPLEGGGIDFLINAHGTDLTAIDSLLQVSGMTAHLPALGPYQVSGHLHDAGEGQLSLADLKGQAGMADKAEARLAGTIADIKRGMGFALDVSVQARNGAALMPFLTMAGLDNAPVAKLPALTASARLTGGGRAYTLTGFKSMLGTSDFAGTLVVKGVGARSIFSADLSARMIDVTELLPIPTVHKGLSSAIPSVRTDARIIPDLPLSLTALQTANLKLRVEKLRLPGMALTDVAATVSMKPEQLVIENLKADVTGGQLSLTARAEPTKANGVLVRLRANGENIALGQFLTELDLLAVDGAPTSLKASLTGQGTTLRALAADLSGQFTLSTGPARLHNKTIERLGSNLVNELLYLLDPQLRSKEFTEIGCGVINIAVKEGVIATEKGIAIETNSVKVTGGGTISLATEALDLALRPQFGSLGVGIRGRAIVNLLRLRGTLAAPHLGVDEVGVARAAATVIAAGKLSFLEELLTGKTHTVYEPCATALGNMSPAPRGAGKDRSR